MYYNRNRKFDWTLIFVSADVFALVLGACISELLNIHPNWFVDNSTASWQSDHLVQLVIQLAIQLFCLRLFHAYTYDTLVRQRRLALRVGAGLFMAAALSFGVTHAFASVGGHNVWQYWLAQTVVMGLSLWTVRKLLRHSLTKLFRKYAVERIIFAGWSKRTERVIRSLEKDLGSFQAVIGFVGLKEESSSLFAQEKGYRLLGSLADLEHLIADHQVTMVLVDEGSTSSDEEFEISSICSRCLVNLKVIPSSFDIWASGLNVQVVAGIPLLGIHELRHERLHNRIVKRAVDIVGAIVGLLLSAPIVGICALLIKRESPGPVFYKQTRVGLYGRPFTMYKLRSMRLDAEQASGPVWAKPNDPRRLKIGEFMRKWNIDETPQFWNVLKGDMSLVGPRPERPEFVEAFNQTVRHYNLRHTAKPGVTGWAAIHGLRGDTSLVDRLEYDLYYVENWSVELDFVIMARTFLPPKNAY